LIGKESEGADGVLEVQLGECLVEDRQRHAAAGSPVRPTLDAVGGGQGRADGHVERGLVLAAGAFAQAPGEQLRVAAALRVVAHAHVEVVVLAIVGQALVPSAGLAPGARGLHQQPADAADCLLVGVVGVGRGVEEPAHVQALLRRPGQDPVEDLFEVRFRVLDEAVELPASALKATQVCGVSAANSSWP
jgi:hypothetical protein